VLARCSCCGDPYRAGPFKTQEEALKFAEDMRERQLGEGERRTLQ
jgi:hypothetical protein